MKKILFVCLGNICRSPTAHGIMCHLVHKAKLTESIICDSAGILSQHQGERPDPRSLAHAQGRGVELPGFSRPLVPEDFILFDYIVSMDDSNFNQIQKLKTTLPKEKPIISKIVKMTDFCSKHQYKEVPDPYFGDGRGFELVFNLLEDACEGLLQKIAGEIPPTTHPS